MRMFLVLALAIVACKTDKADKPTPAPAAPAIPTEGVKPGSTDQTPPAPAKPAEPSNAPAAARDPKAIDSAAARDMIDKGAVVLDVRTKDEFAEDHVEKAVNIPVQEFGTRIAEVDKLTGGDKSKPIVVYCSAGARAAKAKAQLDAAGYKNVVNGGGLDDLQ